MNIFQDLRFAFRTLRRSPGFAAVAVLTLALGVGGTASIFSVVDAIVLRPLPFPHAAELVTVWEDHRALDGPELEWTNSVTLDDWRTQNQSLAGLSGVQGWAPTLTGLAEPRQLNGAAVSAGYFGVLGVGMHMGRGFLPEEDVLGGAPVVVVGYGFWQRILAADSTAVGSVLSLDGTPVTIVGVAGPFDAPLVSGEIWRPLKQLTNADCGRGCYTLRTIGRLRPGVTPELAREDFQLIAGRLANDYPETHRGVGITIRPLKEAVVGNLRASLMVLLASVGLVLLIACVNIASLLLARATTRQHELVLRTALGARQGRLFRQLLTESLVLAVLGGLGGLLVTVWGVDLLVALLPSGTPRMAEIGVNGRVLGFALATTLGTGLVFGLLPATYSARATVAASLGTVAGGNAGRQRARLRGGLVVAEMALAVSLLVGAGLLLRSFAGLQRVDPGFEAGELFTAQVALPSAQYPGPPEIAALFDDLLERLQADRRVSQASAVSILPMTGNDNDLTITLENYPRPEPGVPSPVAWYRQVMPGYFSLLDVPVTAGRAVTDQDAAGAPLVVVINQTLAERYWPGASPVGRRLKFGGHDSNQPWRTVVGVVSDMQHRTLDQPARAQMFLPARQAPSPVMYVVAQASGADPGLGMVIQEHLTALDSQLPLVDPAPLANRVQASMAERQVVVFLLGIFAGFALVLAALGLYGVVSYTAGLRIREIGVRMALGATGPDVLRLVMRQGVRLTGVGIVLGLVAAGVLSRFLVALLYRVSPTDPATFLGVSLVLGGVALLASYLPARRAARLQPMKVLRAD